MASAARWRAQVRSRGSVEEDRKALTRLVEYDSDPFETELYEQSSDPQIRLVDKAERSSAGQYDRRLRRLRERAERAKVDQRLRDMHGMISSGGGGGGGVRVVRRGRGHSPVRNDGLL